MIEGDKVIFNNLVPSYLTRGLKGEIHTVKFIDSKGRVYLEEDTGNPKTIFSKEWMRVVMRA